MLSGFFNYDNPVWRFIGKFADILILNILWIICSIPIFTIGASTTAVYYVTLKLARNEEGYTIKGFFKSFKENFVQSTIIWLILLAVGALLGFDLYYFMRIQTGSSMFRNIMLCVFGGFSIIYIAIATYVFPIQSRFVNPVKKTLFNAFFMSIRHLLMTIGIIAIDVLVILASLTVGPLFMIVTIMGLPLLAFINSYFFNSIFAKYIKEESPKDEYVLSEEIPADKSDEEKNDK